VCHRNLTSRWPSR